METRTSGADGGQSGYTSWVFLYHIKHGHEYRGGSSVEFPIPRPVQSTDTRHLVIFPFPRTSLLTLHGAVYSWLTHIRVSGCG